jgi:hypoxanthine-guanine phosphoribosyltransferase
MMDIQEIISAKEIKEKIRQTAQRIKKDYGKEVFCLVVLEGAKRFFIDHKDELKKLGVEVRHKDILAKSYNGSIREKLTSSIQCKRLLKASP